MKAEIVSIGTELLLGTINDTNAQYLAQRLANLGIDCYYVSQVGDNLDRIVEVLRRGWERSDLTITTGGLGPTGDDLTREAIAAMLGETPTVIPALERQLLEFFARRGVTMPERNLKQATVIPSAQIIANPIGTAPGWWVKKEQAGASHMVVSMPGVPFEMRRMWENEIEPQLATLSGTVIVSRTLKTLGIGESSAEKMVADLMEGSNPTLAPYAKPDGVHLRITAKALNRRVGEEMIAGLEAEVRSRLGTAIYGVDNDTPQSVVSALLAKAGLSVAVLEVGEGAIGSVALLFAGSKQMLGAFGFNDWEHARVLIDGGTAIDSLEKGVRSLLTMTNADLAMGILVTQEAAQEDGSTVRFASEVYIMSSDESGAVRARQSWKTAASEVSRLSGLAALNLLRKWLLDRLEHPT